MRIIKLKNNKDVADYWIGVLIQPGEYYTLQNETDRTLAVTSVDVNQGIWSTPSTLIINDGTNDLTPQMGDNWLKEIDADPRDIDGARIHRGKAAKAGFTYHMTASEFTTSTVGSLVHTDSALTPLNEFTLKFYDANDVELTIQGDCDTSCVMAVLDFEPTWNYEIIGGTTKTMEDVTQNVRVWVVAVPDIPANYGGSKVMVQNVNLKFIDPNNGIVADGRASKFMTYSATYHTNKIRTTIRHAAGLKLELMVALEVFRQ